ncbi:MAG: PatB family C-S lyase [Prevotellaceae bacterium]|jgi:cystathionine beta-lyase|nr:PatB family C-S lyase [Prevotellaceae bacterium]
MKLYDFDTCVERRNTDSEKWNCCTERFGTNEIIPLWVADMDFKTPDFVMDALRKRMDHEILGYAYRLDSFYESLKNWLKRRAGWEIDLSDLSFAPGIVPAFNFAVLAFTEPGDKILINSPVYHPFMYAINDHGRTIVKNSLTLDDKGLYSIDFDDLEAKLAEGVKMYLFCSPHNPVGRVWTREELQRIGDLCVKYEVLLISDEIHSDLIFRPHKHIHTASLSESIARQTVTLLAPSKTFNLAGTSTSAIHTVNRRYLDALNKLINSLHITQGNIFGNVAFEAAYNFGDEWLEQLLVYLEGNFDYIIDYVDEHIPGIKIRKPEGTYLMWLDCRELGMNQQELNTFMVQEAKLAMNPGTLFGDEGAGFMRLNAATPRSILREAMLNLRNAVGRLPSHKHG